MLFADYVACQERVSAVWMDPDRWTHMGILNTARAGKSSSDRATPEHCDEIWKVPSMRIALG
jgi:glycogen phosphorylase